MSSLWSFGEIASWDKKILEFQASNEQLRQENRVLQSEIEELESQIRLVKNGNLLQQEEPFRKHGNEWTSRCHWRMPRTSGFGRRTHTETDQYDDGHRNCGKIFCLPLLCEYLSENCFDRNVNRQVLDRLKQNSVTDGSWRWIGVTIARGYREATKRGMVIKNFSLVDQLDGSWSEFSETLRDLTNRRNEIHDPVNADPGPCCSLAGTGRTALAKDVSSHGRAS